MGRKIKPFTAELEIVDTSVDGRGIARHEERVVFVQNAVPGDVAEVFIYRKEKRALAGKAEKLIKASPWRVKPKCQHFEHCSGCKWQQLDYEAQLRFKQQEVVETLRRVGKLEARKVLPIKGVKNPYFYRNKLEFTFSNEPYLTSDQGDRDSLNPNVLGFHVPRLFFKILDIEECLLQKPIVNDIRNAVREFAREEGLTFYDHREHTGLLRSLVFRTSEHSGELMLLLIVAEKQPQAVDRIFTHLKERFPQITDFLWMHNPKKNSSYSELPFTVWEGKPYITERIGEYDFRIRPTSFFQTNPKQAKHLYEVVRDFLLEALPEGQTRFPILYDLYSGTGSIGIFLSAWADKIVGIEYVEAAIQDARENARLNGLEERCTFYAGDIKRLLGLELLTQEGRPDIMVADPPRQGMDPKVVKQILQLAPEHLIYVSCKPATQARDLAALAEQYELLAIQPVDMFPHTAHVENVAFLKKRA